jgi:kynurenine 3-monooxygenase
MPKREYTLIGAGLAGSLLALLLARRGESVRVFERRPDPRNVGYLGGRSINLALSERGLHGLRLAGLERAVMDQAVMMRGRMVHEIGEAERFMRYGKDDSEVIWSVNRGRLNTSVLQAAEDAGAQVHFDCALEAVDFEHRELRFTGSDRLSCQTTFDSVIGADGAGSALRAAMLKETDLGEHIEWLGHSYKELEIPPAPGGGSLIEPNALHIWPRGGYMLIALPNVDGSFTVTLFLANQGHPSFATLDSIDAVRDFFVREFPSATPLMPEYLQDFQRNPTGLLATLRLDQWHIEGRALLLGDAAHAIVPFHGQGMNCAFEDCVELDQLLADHSDLESAFAEFHVRRKPNADAIADMAIENYVEMRDSVADDRFVLLKQLERSLAGLHPERFVPRYSMVMFRRVGYAEAQRRGRMQWQILEDLLGPAADLDDIDYAEAERRIHTELTPLAD